MKYCPPNVTLNEIWVDHGVSQCFMDTVSTTVTAGFLLLFGTTQLWIYKKYATTVSAYSLPKSTLYYLQIFFLLLLPALSIARLILQATLLNDHVIYGHMVLAVCLLSVSSLYSIVIVVIERKYMLPSVPTRGHGLVLLIYWTLLFITENLAFLNLKKEEWWFRLTEYAFLFNS
jgi:ATP-binding cassette subfamily B (MDR/TAP) protein 6